MVQNPARGIAGAIFDRFAGWSFGLPAESCNYSVDGVRIPLDDGVELTADLYRPIGCQPSGTLVVVGPYGRGVPMALANARVFASRGYQVLFASTRGTFGSGGEFDPARTDVTDCQGIVVWMKKQPWYTGSFATLGSSFLGFTQWALLEHQPAEMIAAVISAGPHDYSRHYWGTGALNLNQISWADMIVHQEDPGLLTALVQMMTAKKRLRPVIDAVPLADAVDKHFAGRAPWFRERLARPDLTDPFWKPMQLKSAVERASLPILLITGWYDIFLKQTMEQYVILSERGVNVALTVGPWTHMTVVGSETIQQTLGWIDGAFNHSRGNSRKATVRIYVTGAAEWRDIPAWPPLTAPQELYLGPGGKLLEKLSEHDIESKFEFNPELPTPTIGGPLMSGGGSVNDTALGARPDVLSFTTSPLGEDVEVLGKPMVQLAHTSDKPHADLFVRLSELDAKGVSRNITETFVRLESTPPFGPVELYLLDCAHRFQKGNSIRLIIAGSCHPQFARNLGTGENAVTGTALQAVTHAVRYGGSMVSKVILPVCRC